MKKIVCIFVFIMSLSFFNFSFAKNIVVSEDLVGNPKAEITLTWAALPHYSLSNPYQQRADYLFEAAERFAKKNPEVKILPTLLTGDVATQVMKLLQQQNLGKTPDIVQIDSFYLPVFKDKLQNLNKYITRTEFDDFLPYVKKGIVDKDGNIKAIWFTTDVRVLFYRKDLIKTPPTTWDELITVAKNISKKYRMTGFLFPAGRGEGTSICNFPYFWAQGGKLVDEKGRPVFNLGPNRKYMINVLDFIKRLVDEGVSPRRVVNIKSESDVNGDVIGNNVAMFIGGNWQIKQLSEVMGEEEFAKKWDIAPLPQFKKGMKATSVGGWTWGITTDDPKKQAAAIRFITTLYFGKEGMAGWTKNAGYLPTRKSVYKEFSYYSENPWMEKLLKIAEDGYVRPGYPIYPTISTEFQVAIANVIEGKQSPEEALNNAWAEVMKKYNEIK
ncbi:carbohydrate ABC transporter substrate-binding protein, CUT1 family [Marinitoga hydrogenitolerans DSM 16785]|uniref:Carbohydrate ABC transporter substrate-binding protein, CUT1 family n=1 Tax=Marinitoga hydrogenitolerans (strain DSM 16785 / JCM 12826 / AT1271) TaxID=1122195 RepID=A0A1M4SKY3_MARH1|nr:extracellular solute-binding protein [Marinitoga hydrogenitolerans]SHE32808.1 carbohydrate ABC transporter substrate-binding protein, CUT1 family [Marinitoga hydrogenitolerans DSM 16785]